MKNKLIIILLILTLLFISCEKKISQEDYLNSLSSLHLAVIEGDTDTVIKLIESGEHINSIDCYGLTPIFYTFFHKSPKREELFNHLYDFNADILRKTSTSFSLKNIVHGFFDDEIKIKIENNNIKIMSNTDLKYFITLLNENNIIDQNNLNQILYKINTFDLPLKNAYMVLAHGSDKTKKEAEKKLDKYLKKGMPYYSFEKTNSMNDIITKSYPKIMYSSQVEGLNPGYWIVVSAICTDSETADTLASFLKKHKSGGYVRNVKVREPDDLELVVIESALLTVNKVGMYEESFVTEWEITNNKNNLISNVKALKNGYAVIPNFYKEKELRLFPKISDDILKPTADNYIIQIHININEDFFFDKWFIDINFDENSKIKNFGDMQFRLNEVNVVGN